MAYAIHIDTFSSLDDLKPKDRKDPEAVLSALRTAKRFSCFEASEYQSLARTLVVLQESGRLKIDHESQYPWVDVVEIDGVKIQRD